MTRRSHVLAQPRVWTQFEEAVAVGVASRKRNKEIAGDLDCSVTKVTATLTALYKELFVDRAGLAKVWRSPLLPPTKVALPRSTIRSGTTRAREFADTDTSSVPCSDADAAHVVRLHRARAAALRQRRALIAFLGEISVAAAAQPAGRVVPSAALRAFAQPRGERQVVRAPAPWTLGRLTG